MFWFKTPAPYLAVPSPVQIGDVLDRGIGEYDILMRLAKLSRQAAMEDGKVIQLMGNHELMNYQADWRYVSGAWGDGFAPFDTSLSPHLDAPREAIATGRDG